MKKVLSLVLAALLVFGMATVAFAAAPKISAIDKDFDYTLGVSGDPVNGSIHLDEIRPDAEYKLYMNVDCFEWADGNKPADGNLTSSHLSTYKLTVKKKVSKGSSVIDTVELKRDGDAKTMYIKVAFVEDFVSTSDQDFDFTVYLAKSSTKQKETEVQITGTMANEEITVDDGDEEVDLSGDAFAKADGYIKSIQVDSGNGLYINTKMFDGKKYYAKSSQDVKAADDAVLNEYPEIDTIYYLNTINMNSAGNTVEFDIDDRYYVYDADGKYVGTTADKLPFSSKYYLATARINMESGSEVVEEPGDDEPVDPSNPETGGDDVPANIYDNPGTGR